MKKTILLLAFAVVVCGAPATEENTPVKTEKTCVKAEKTPVKAEKPCVIEENTPAKEENTPAKEEKTPAKAEKTSAKEEKTPVKEEKTPAKAEKTSAKEEKTPVKEEKTPAKEVKSHVKAVKTSVKEEKTLLGELNRNLHNAIIGLKSRTLEHKLKDIFLEDLKMDATCSEDVFCKAERELKKVSGLTEYNDFRTDGILMRKLRKYNDGTTCDDKAADEGSVQVLLLDFLKSLKKCVQNAYSKK